MQKKNETPVNLYAFWRWDIFPFVLGSEITKVGPTGAVYAKNYEGWFYPIIVLPIEAGKILQARLDQLNFEFKEQEKALKERFNLKLETIAPQLCKKKET